MCVRVTVCVYMCGVMVLFDVLHRYKKRGAVGVAMVFLPVLEGSSKLVGIDG